MNMQRFVIMLSALAFLAAGASTLIASDETWPYRVLEETRGSDDALPQEVLDSATAHHDLGDRDSARRVGEFHGSTYYLMEGAAEETVCLVRHERDVSVAALCTPATAEFERPSMMSGLDKNYRRVSAVIVRDGYTSAVVRSGASEVRVPVTRNGAFFSTGRAATIELRGAGKPMMSVRVPKLRSIARRP